MHGAGVPYCPCYGSPTGEHGVSPFDEPLWPGGCCCSGHYIVVAALKDCAPDLRRRVVAVCRWGREVVVWGAEASGAEGGVAGWCGGLFPLFRVVWVCWVVLLRWGSAQACGPSTCDVGVGVLCQGLTQPDRGIQTCCPWAYWRARQSTRSTIASWGPLSGVGRPWRPLTVSLLQLSYRWYQTRGVFRALPWVVARRRSGSRMVVGVRGGCSGSGGHGGVGCRGPAHPRRCMGGPWWAWLGWAVPGGPLGARWVLGCRGCLWQGALVVGPAGLLWCSGGVLEACGRRWGGVCGARSR